MAESLQYTAELVDAITPVLEKIATALLSIADTMTQVAEVLTATFDDGTVAADDYSLSLDQVITSNDDLAAALDMTMATLDEVTAALTDNTAAIDENTAAQDQNATSQKEGNKSNKESAGSLLGIITTLGMAGFAFYQMGSSGEDALNRVSAFAGATADQMKLYTAGVAQIGMQVGKTTTDMANGLYDVVSAGYQGSDALNVLQIAAEAAAAGGVDLHTVTNGVTSIMHAFSIEASHAADVTDLLITGVRDGKSSFQDYSNAIALVAVTSHSAGFSMNEAAAALSTLTLVFPSAQRAGQDLNFLLRAIGVDAGKTGDAARKMGLSFDDAQFNSMSLIERLQYLQEITHGNQQEFLKLVGGANGFAAAQVLLEQNGSNYNKILTDMANKSGATQTAFEQFQETVSSHVGKMVSALSTLAVNLLTVASPFISALLDKLATAFGGLATFIETHGSIMGPVLAALGAVIMGVVVAALWSLVGGLVAAVTAAAPIIAVVALVIGALVGLGIGIKNAYEHSKPFRDAVDGIGSVLRGLKDNAITLWNVLVGQLGPVFQQIGNTLRTNLLPVWHDIQQWMENFGQQAKHVGQVLEESSKHTKFFSDILHNIGDAVGWVLQKLSPLVDAFKAQIGPVLHEIGQVIHNNVLPAWQSLQQSFQQALPVLKFIGEVVGGILVGAFGILISFWKGAISAFGPLLSGVIGFFGGLITAFSGVIQVIVSIWSGAYKFFDDLFHGRFGKLLGDLGDIFKGVWSGILKILSGVGDGISSLLGGIIGGIWGWLTGFFSGLDGFFGGIFSKAISAIGRFFGDIGSHIAHSFQAVIHGIGSFFGTIGGIFIGGFNIVKGIVQGAINFVIGIFRWMYEHNTYFKAMVDDAVKMFTTLKDEVVKLVTGFIKLVQDKWKELQDDTKKAWDWVKEHIITPITDTWHKAQEIIDKVKKVFSDAWDNIVHGVEDAWNRFTDRVGKAEKMITDAVHDHIIQPIQDKISGLWDQCVQWGKNLIDFFVNGIKSNVGKVVDVIKGMVGDIAKFLGFHSPTEEGPGREAHKWAPALINMFAGTMLDAMPAIESATKRVATTIQQGLNQPLHPGGMFPPELFGGRPTGIGLTRPGGDLHIHLHAEGGLGDGLSMLNSSQQEKLARFFANTLNTRSSLQSAGVYGYSGT